MTDAISEKKDHPFLKRFAVAGTIISVLAGSLGLYNQLKPSKSYPDLRGTWRIIKTVEKTSKSDYLGDVYEYEVYVKQKDNLISGSGEQTRYNQKSAKSHFQLQWVDEEITDDFVLINYVLKANRDASGQMKLNFDPDNPKHLIGTYNSAIADSKGRVEVFIE